MEPGRVDDPELPGRSRSRLAARQIGIGGLLVLLTGVGVFSATSRAVVVVSSTGAPADAELSGPDRRSLIVLARVLRLEPTSPRFIEIETDFLVATRKFLRQRRATLLHVIPGAIFLALAPLQLLPGLRTRCTRVHRWTGRALLLLAAPLAISGFYLAVRSPASGLTGGSASVVFGLLFVVAGSAAYTAVRRGDLVRHRAWMLRFLAVAYGVAVIRLLDVALLAVVPVRPRHLGGPSFWLGWLLSVGAAEWWIRKTGAPSRATPVEEIVALDAAGTARSRPSDIGRPATGPGRHGLVLVLAVLATPLAISAQQARVLVGTEVREALEAHNDARARLGVPPLVWDTALAETARRCLVENRDRTFEHCATELGENMYASTRTPTPSEAVAGWMSEEPTYDVERRRCRDFQCGHFTQVVWSETRRMGCAIGEGQGDWILVICNYDPAGNYGYYGDNSGTRTDSGPWFYFDPPPFPGGSAAPRKRWPIIMSAGHRSVPPNIHRAPT